MELYANLAETTVATGGYTSGSGDLNVASTASPFPASGDFRVAVSDPTTGQVKVLLKVTAINSSTQFAVTAEGSDTNALAGDKVTAVLTAGALDSIRSNISQAGTFASLPASGKAGDVYHFTDSCYDYARHDGSAWRYFRGGRQMTPPIDGDFAWVNQGSASVDTTNGGIYLQGPLLNSVSLRIRKKALATLPVTYEIGFLFAAPGGNILTAGGLVLRESGTSKLVTCGFIATGSLNSYRYDTETSAATNISQFVVGHGLFSGELWARLTVDSSNRTMYFSANGLKWHQWHQTTRTANFTTAPDEIGFYVNPHNASYDVALHLLHWKEL